MLTVTYYRLKALAASPLTLLLMLLVPAAALFTLPTPTRPGQAAIPFGIVDLDGSEYSRLVAERRPWRLTGSYGSMGPNRSTGPGCGRRRGPTPIPSGSPSPSCRSTTGRAR